MAVPSVSGVRGRAVGAVRDRQGMVQVSGKWIDAVLLETAAAPRWVRVPVDAQGSTLEGLQGRVRGFVEPVDLGGDVVMWANEDGLGLALDGVEGFGPNVLATRLAVAAHGSWSLIYGPCVVTGDLERDGMRECVSLRRDLGDWIITRLVAGVVVTASR